MSRASVLVNNLSFALNEQDHLFVASALSNTNAAALQASLAGAGLSANLTTSSLLNSSLTNELASNLNNFGGGGLSGLQASLAGGQGNNSFAPRGLSKLDNDIGFGSNNAFGGSNFGGGSRDFDGGFNRGDSDRVSGGGGGGFSGNQGQSGGNNRQNSNGSRPIPSDTILIGNVLLFCSFSLLLFVILNIT